jgi:hypothetical protein
MPKKLMQISLLLFIIFILTGCVAGSNIMVNTPNAAGTIAGFWLGLWHGFISPISFLLSLFMKNVHVYEVHNNGGWYNFGFLLGASAMFGGSDSTRRHVSSKKSSNIHINL